MRAILGKVDCPDSAYILVLRGIDEKTLEYYGYHLKKYYTWGCIVFSEMNEAERSFDVPVTSIHKIFSGRSFASASDEQLIEWVRRNFPPFLDDEGELTEPEFPTFEKKSERLNYTRVIDGMILADTFLDKKELIEREVLNCKKGILDKILSESNFWETKLSMMEGTGGMKVQVSLNVGVVDMREESISDALRRCEKSIESYEYSLKDTADIIKEVADLRKKYTYYLENT